MSNRHILEQLIKNARKEITALQTGYQEYAGGPYVGQDDAETFVKITDMLEEMLQADTEIEYRIIGTEFVTADRYSLDASDDDVEQRRKAGNWEKFDLDHLISAL